MPGDYDFGLNPEQEQRAAELHRTSFSVDMCSMGPGGPALFAQLPEDVVAVQSEVNTYWSFALPCDGLEYEWSSMADFFQHLERVGQAYEVAILTDQNVLRTSATTALTASRILGPPRLRAKARTRSATCRRAPGSKPAPPPESGLRTGRRRRSTSAASESRSLVRSRRP